MTRGTSTRSRLIHWTADVEDDLASPDRLRVFVPSVMGAGLLVSLAILFGDLVRRVLPDRTRRHRRIQQRAIDMVTPVAHALGAPAPILGPMRWRLRSRRAYVAIAAASLSASPYVAIGSYFNYTRPGGYLEGEVWVFSLALIATAALFGLAVAAATLAMWPSTPPGWTRPLVERTLLGVRDSEAHNR